MSQNGLVAVALAVIAAAVCLADGAVVRNNWVTWDDEINLHGNPDFNPPTRETLGNIWREQRAHLYIPVTYTVWWLLAAATWTHAGLSPAVFHAASVALHVLAAWLVFAIALRLTRSMTAACLGAVFFAVHPAQVETVAWASGAKDLLAATLSLAAIWLFLMRCDTATSRHNSMWLAVATAMYGLALLAKPSAVVVPLILLAVVWIKDYKIPRDAWYVAAAWLTVAMPIVVLTRWIQPAIDVFVPPFWQRPIIALDALGFYVRSIVWPVRLAFVYGRTPDVQLASPWLNVAIALIGAAIIAYLARRQPIVAGAAAIFVIALLPYSGFTPFDFQAYSSVSDHYLYLAMLGPALLFACLVRDRPAIWWYAAAAVLVLLGIISHEQTQIWRGKMSLLRHAVAANPDRSPPRAALAAELVRRDDLAQAEREYRRALEISPRDAESHTRLAQLLTRGGRNVEAMEQYRQAHAITPHDTLRINNLAVGLASIGQTAEAIAVLRAALDEDDRSNAGLLHANLGRLLLSQGEVVEARAELKEALAIDPSLDHARRGLELIQQAEDQFKNQQNALPSNP